MLILAIVSILGFTLTLLRQSAIASKRGLGKFTNVRNNDVKLVKVLRTSKPADIIIEYEVPQIHKPKFLSSVRQNMNMRSEAGRPVSAPTAIH